MLDLNRYQSVQMLALFTLVTLVPLLSADECNQHEKICLAQRSNLTDSIKAAFVNDICYLYVNESFSQLEAADRCGNYKLENFKGGRLMAMLHMSKEQFENFLQYHFGMRCVGYQDMFWTAAIAPLGKRNIHKADFKYQPGSSDIPDYLWAKGEPKNSERCAAYLCRHTKTGSLGGLVTHKCQRKTIPSSYHGLQYICQFGAKNSSQPYEGTRSN